MLTLAYKVASLNFTKLVHNVSRVERNVDISIVTILSFKPLSLFSHGTLRLTLVAHFEIIESCRNPIQCSQIRRSRCTMAIVLGGGTRNVALPANHQYGSSGLVEGVPLEHNRGYLHDGVTRVGPGRLLGPVVRVEEDDIPAHILRPIWHELKKKKKARKFTRQAASGICSTSFLKVHIQPNFSRFIAVAAFKCSASKAESRWSGTLYWQRSDINDSSNTTEAGDYQLKEIACMMLTSS